MTRAQEKDLFIEWGLYEPQEQKKMIEEYLSISNENCSRERFLNFLKKSSKLMDTGRRLGWLDRNLPSI